MKEFETRYRWLFETAQDGLLILDGETGEITDVNPSLTNMVGHPCEELVGKQLWEIGPFKAICASKATFSELQKKGRVRLGDLPIKTKNGADMNVEFVCDSYIAEDKKIIQCTIRNIRRCNPTEEVLHKQYEELELGTQARTAELEKIREPLVVDLAEREKAQEHVNFTNDLLKLFTKKSTRKEYLSSVVELIHGLSGCCCVGIRVLDTYGNIPYESYVGFSQEFWASENWLSVKDHQCACIRVILEKPEPQDIPAMTRFGSFRSDNTMTYVSEISEQEQSRFRGVCVMSGFTSVAIIPIRYREEVLGAIHIADKKEGMVPLELVEFLEAMSPLIGEAMYRFSTEDELKTYYQRLEELVKERTVELGETSVKLRLEKEKLQKYLEVAGVIFVVIDASQRVSLINRKGCEILGYDEEEIIGKNWFDNFVPDNERQLVKKAFTRLMAGEIEPVEYFENRVLTRTGAVRLIAWHNTVLGDESGTPVGTLSSGEDITERKKVAEALLESEKRLRLATDAARLGVFEWDVQNDIPIWDNSRMFEIFGLSPEDQPVDRERFEREVLHPDDLPGFQREIMESMRNHMPFKGRYRIRRRNDGQWCWIEYLGQFEYAENGDVIRLVSVLNDITERERAEEELRKSREDLNRAQAVAQTGSWRLDVRKDELTWSEENHRIFGIPQGTQMTYETFLHKVHPEDRAYVHEKWSAALRGEPYDIEHRVIVGGKIKWLRERAELEFDKEGNLMGGFGTTQDITERKHAEEERLKLTEELQRSNEDLDQFASFVAHDLNTPLNGIGLFANYLAKRYRGSFDAKADEAIGYMVDGVERAKVLISSLLAYSRITAKKDTYRPVYCSVTLEEAIFNLRSAIEESSAELTYDILPIVQGDASQLVSLFQNLLGNAIKFRGTERPKIHLSVAQKGGEWLFSVQDNGIGIESQFLERIFGVFKRLHTSEQYEGTGIGLAITKKIVERHGGRIWVESEPGKGTTFYFTIPKIGGR